MKQIKSHKLNNENQKKNLVKKIKQNEKLWKARWK